MKMHLRTFKVRICRLNHRTGPILDPSNFYGSNPYNKSEQVPEDYSTVSKFLNIDTGSLAKEAKVTSLDMQQLE